MIPIGCSTLAALSIWCDFRPLHFINETAVPVAAVDEVKTVGAHFGLAPRRFQSDDTDRL
jgi:hypothetical protein